MNTAALKVVRSALVAHLSDATAHELGAIVSALGVRDPSPEVAAVVQSAMRARRGASPIFEIVSDDIARDLVTGYEWLRPQVPGGKRNHEDSIAAALKCDIAGGGWRPPEIWERTTIVDYTRREPALNTDVFRGEVYWEWTNTLLVEPDGKPSGVCAWCVYSYYGIADLDSRYSSGFVRAVRGGQ